MQISVRRHRLARLRRGLWLVLSLALAVALPGSPAFAQLTSAGDIVVASTTDDGIKANGQSIGSSMSADGIRVAFDSMATNLHTADTDAARDVYVKDLATGDLILASSADDGTKANGDSSRPSMSADGTEVAFESTATNLDLADTDAARDVYVKDLVTGDVMLASITAAGTKGNLDSFRSSLSSDGTSVAFESFATNLDPAPADLFPDIFVKDLVTGDLSLASAADDGTKGNGDSSRPSLSADGRRVAFGSTATNLDPADLDECEDLFVKDVVTGDLILASTTAAGTKGGCFGRVGGSSAPSMSEDGMKVAFESTAPNFNPDFDTSLDVYVKDLDTGDLALASVGLRGDQYRSSLSADGSRVAFESCFLCDFVVGPFPDIYVRDLATGELVQASTADDATGGNDGSSRPSLAAGGTHVAFDSTATNLDPADPDGIRDVYVKGLESAADNDEDGLSDEVELALGTEPDLADSDGDGLDDFTETDAGSPVDTDGDGTIDALDPDSDGDGIPDASEGAADTDGDGTPDYRDLDSDDDGLPDALELPSGTDRLDPDSDTDGIVDGQDPDTVAAVIRSLRGDVFRSPSEGTRTAFLSRLEAIEADVAAGDSAGAIESLTDLRRRVDGCDPLLPAPIAPDSNDWIRGTPTDPCSAQDQVRDLIDLLIANLDA